MDGLEIPEVPYVPGWSMPRTYDEAITEVKKLREGYAAKCVELDSAKADLTEALTLLRRLTDKSKEREELLKESGTTVSRTLQAGKEMAMLMRKLMRRLPADDALVMQAQEYLERSGFAGSILRKPEDPNE
jgi:hypothetical protein